MLCHLGYSSERQLSLDLVNVGRQRLDFLPLLKHSGTYRESAMHSGTFAQEIITLVHQVKENYFQGQGITLNERFSNEQHYSFMDEDEFTVEGQELKEMGPKINRPLSIPSSDTQIFCKIGSLQAQRRRQITDPGDLRYDLERRRQQRLEGVKITIAGGNFFQIGSQSQEIESAYVEEEDPHEDEDDFDWSEQIDPGQKLPARRNFKRFKNRLRRQIRNNPNDGASW
ncbi:BCLAF1 and THRAP3 family member 3 isoform X3 [Electrophorus electricus]|uniref:BCLAF1 and THRAP3 family member 3 isoform X3 n=1 Tax=Electrophorus electricus TaxID=8005 RepID=UPI0015D050C3|nr:BCLAF1 and THRAP3 family member 3 isoform X3 [Electrophorus electricus]